MDSSGTHPLTRRGFLRRSAVLAAGAPVLTAAVAGCGGSSSLSSSSGSASGKVTPGTITMLNYPGWIGAHEVSQFEKLHPGVSVKQVSGYTSGGDSATAAQIIQNRSSYDMGLLTAAVAGHLKAAAALGTYDYSKIPNIRYVPEKFRQAFPYGVPTDYGKVGFGYRRDLMSERPSSWADFWRLTPKYSGKVVLLDYDSDVIGTALKSLGFSGNSIVPAQVNQAQAAVIKLKPHLLEFTSTNVTHPLINGSAVMAMDYDFDIALAHQTQPDIVWVAPSDGMVAYIEGWAPIAGTSRQADVEALTNFHLEPRHYADFVNTTGTAYVEPAASRYIKPAISKDATLAYTADTLARVEFEGYLGNGTELWASAWEKIKAA